MMGALVAAVILALIVAGLSQILGRNFKSLGRASLGGDLETLKASLEQSLDCTAILTGVNLTSECNTTSAPNGQASAAKYLRLYRMTQFGSKPLTAGTPFADNSYPFGNWRIRTTCSAAEGSLVVRVARVNSDGSFVKDPQSGRPLDWSSPRGLIVGNGAYASKLCFSSSPSRTASGSFQGQDRSSSTTFTVTNTLSFTPSVIEIYSRGVSAATIGPPMGSQTLTQYPRLSGIAYKVNGLGGNFGILCHDPLQETNLQPYIDSQFGLWKTSTGNSSADLFGWEFQSADGSSGGIRIIPNGFQIQPGSAGFAGSNTCENGDLDHDNRPFYWIAYP